MALLTLAACGEEGNPSAAPTPQTTESGTATESVPNTTAPGGDVFAGIDPCKLMDEVLAGEGYRPAKKNKIVRGGNACEAKKGKRHIVGISLIADVSFDDIRTHPEVWPSLDPDEVFDGNVNERRAILVKDRLGGGGSCEIAIEVKPAAIAILGASFDESTEETCKYLSKIAERVEPLLPGK